MFCRNCGKEVVENAVACMNCGCNPVAGGKFCANCGAETGEGQEVCTKCGVALKSASVSRAATKSERVRLVYILLGVLGVFLPIVSCSLLPLIPIHNFYGGRIKIALVQLAASLVIYGSNFILGALTVGIYSLFIALPLAIGMVIWFIVELCIVNKDEQGNLMK